MNAERECLTQAFYAVSCIAIEDWNRDWCRLVADLLETLSDSPERNPRHKHSGVWREFRAKSRSVFALLCSYEAKGICALLSFVLVGPNLGKVLFVLERYCQPGVVPIVGIFHSRNS